MSNETTIEWTDATFNPWWGCMKVSAGCTHCYAETWDKRYGGAHWGPASTTTRRTFGDKHWQEPRKWNKKAEQTGKRMRVFCASMADVFEDHPQVVSERAKLFDLISETPYLDWQLLTKRPENIKPMLIEAGRGFQSLPPWVWIGTSVENQEQANIRIPHLLKVPAHVRFLSCEPLLGPVDLSKWVGEYYCSRCRYRGDDCGPDGEDGEPECHQCGTTYWGGFARVEVHGALDYADRNPIHWVIAGGESGHGARPMALSWARSLRDQCQSAGVAFHFKQWGEHTPYYEAVDPESGNLIMSEYQSGSKRVGKHRSGRILDGRTWDEMPESVPASSLHASHHPLN